MDPLLRATGKIIQLRHAVHRWLEYSIGMGIVAVATIGVGKWQSWPVFPLVALLIVLTVLCLGVAGHYTIQVLATETYSRRLNRSRTARRRT